MASVAFEVGISPPRPDGLALELIAAWPETPDWYTQAPQALQSYVSSIAEVEQSIMASPPALPGSATYDPEALSAGAAIVQSLSVFEAWLTQDATYSAFASLAATATGLDHVEELRDPIALAKALGTGLSTPTWYSQIPANLQTYVRDIAVAEQSILGKAGAVPTLTVPVTVSVPTPSCGPQPGSGEGVRQDDSASLTSFKLSGALAAAMLAYVVGFL